MRRPLTLVFVLAGACLGAAHAADDAQALAGGTLSRPLPRHAAAGSSLERRIQTLAKFLDLDVAQQSELRKVLENQREQVGKIWNDLSVPAAYRVGATRAISDKAADQIRALLNEEQRKEYNPPRRPREAAADSNKRSVEDWMNATRPKPATPAADHD
jgi:hypothetical protein